MPSFSPQLAAGSSIYPQPVTGEHFSLHYYNAAAAGNAAYSLTDIGGRQVMSGRFLMQHGDGALTLTISKDLPNGLYILHAGPEKYKVLVSR